MKLYYFKIPKKKILSFVQLCESLDVVILVSWIEDGNILQDDDICGYVRIHKSAQIPETLQIEKLTEKFGNNIKAI